MKNDEAFWHGFENKMIGGSGSSGTSRQASPKLYDFSKTSGKNCYDTHPPLAIGDTGLVVYGGSCSHPVVKDADVYIGFDWSMTFTDRHYPWTPGHEILYKISDMRAPEEAKHFTKLVSWTAEQLHAGGKVHCGCIGGHGRTGLFLSALVKHMTGIEDAIGYVRKGYCSKAVESSEQIAFLGKHFGILPAKETKPHVGAFSGNAVAWSSHKPKGSKASRTDTAMPIADGNNIWGARCS